MTSTLHIPVLLNEVLAGLSPRAGDVVLDATAGGGGHSEGFLTLSGVKVIALDEDAQALVRVRERLGRFAPRLTLIEGNFADLKELLKKENVNEISHAIFDLGFSSDQLTGKGLSFQSNEPLSMHYGKVPRLGITAAELLNSWSEKDIANVLFGYGEERRSRVFARTIVERRKTHPFATTHDLASLIEGNSPRKGRIHPATKVFQALRIAVNDELSVIKTGLRAAVELLHKGGRIAVISFHSIEDRVVKEVLRDLANEGKVSLVTKKPLAPSIQEKRCNPRSRSAKLRVAQKV